MKLLLVLSAVLALAVAETYKDTHDGLDVEAIVGKLESLKKITQCFLDQGECTEIASAFKKVLPEATAEACAKCTPVQKHMLRRYLEELKKNLPEDFEAVKQKYDPEGKHVDALRAALADA